MATTSASTTLAGTNTLFSTQLSAGNKIRIGANTYRTIQSVTNNTTAVLTVAASASVSGQVAAKFTTNPVSTRIAFAESISVAAPSRILVNNVVANNTINAVAPATTSGGNNTLDFVWTPVYPGTYTVTTQTIANNTAVAINIRSTNADTETANTVVSTLMASAAGTYTLS
ncbi:MAG: hypothetical protein K2P52_02555 [Campylobacterales bacterium]|nr:hypothetical protein [Campylobacterales bacterium]